MSAPGPGGVGTPRVEWRAAWTPAEGADRARAGFAAAFGGEPAGVWAAPGRVNVIGEHTDYNAGLCLPVALAHRTYVALRPRPDGVVRLVSAQEPTAWEGRLADVGPGTVQGWAAYAVGVAWALREAGLDVPGFDAAVDSCVPYGAGLSSSAALEGAFAVALDDVVGAGLGADDAGRARLVAACRRAENEIAGAPTGGLDQTAALRSVPGHALALDFRDGSVRPVPARLGEHALLVVDTRAPHRNADGQYAARRAACEDAARRLGLPSLREVTDLDAALDRLAADGAPPETGRRVRHVVTENARVTRAVALLAEDRVAELGPVLTAGHASLRDDYEVSCPELDVAVDAAVAAGALGARMVGGGFGGSALALVRREDVAAVAEGVGAAFAAAGFGTPALLVAEPSGPGGRVEPAGPVADAAGGAR